VAAINSYATLTEFQSWKDVTETDTTDDTVIEDILEAASRYIDGATARTFYPRVQTRYYDIPSSGSRQLDLDDDLLEIITLTNGDDVEVESTEYNLIGKNQSPHYAIKLKASSSVYWNYDSSGNWELIIDALAIWGYHDQYATRAWSTGSTINESAEFSSSDVTLTTAAGTLFSDSDQLLKIDDEILRTTAKSTDDLTVVRGENGSTAAAHDDGTTIYIWQPIHDIQAACLQIAHSYYSRRYGENESADSVITVGGVVITPRDIPGIAAQTVRRYKRWL